MSNLNFKKLRGIFLFLMMIPVIAWSQNITVSGRVVDNTGEGIIGASVFVPGTNNGIITGINGDFTLNNVPSNGQLQFSYIGYTTQIVNVSGRTVINITLAENANTLEEVVVVGYGTMKKLDVSGSIVSANAKTINEIPSTNVAAALQGRLPGIEMLQTSTRPGAGMQIRIRGERSLSGSNDPLIVVDGIPFGGSLTDIATSDIKSVDILKDASATAIYGARGSNGVILITTSRGGEMATAGNVEPTVFYSGYHGIKSVAKKYQVYNAEEYKAFKHATVNATYKDKFTALEEDMIAKGQSTDWQDLMYGNAHVTSHDVGIASAHQKGSYSFGGSFYNETTVLPGQEYTRFSLRTTIDQEIGKFLKVGLSSQNAYGITDGESAGMMNNIITLSPLMPAYNSDKSIRKIPTEGHVDTYYNPLLLKDDKLWQETRKRYSTYNSLYGEIKFTPELKYRLNIGLNFYEENYGSFFGSDTPYQNGGVSTAKAQDRHFTSWTVENLLYYDKILAEKHRINATAMYSAEEVEFQQKQMSANDITADYSLWYNLGLADGAKTIAADQQNYYKTGLNSFMARVLYAYEDRYTLTATYRADGASRLAPGHKWHNYTAFSAGWNINNEAFLRDMEAISLLKLRFGYGETSNQAVEPYATLGRLSQAPYNFGNNNLYGAYATTLPNPGLGWEYTKNYNLGIDFGFLKGRITGYLELYRQKTSDVLVQVQLPSSSGVSNPVWQNVGTTENKGIEFSVSAQVIKPEEKDGFGWDLDFNIYANRNKLLSLNSGVTVDEGNGFFVGHPFNVIYDYEKTGIIQESEAPYMGYAAGKIKVADISGPDGTPDGKIDSYDRKVLGAFEPDFSGGLSTRFYYKNFDLSVVSFFKSGGLLVSTMHMPHSYQNTNNGRRNSIKVDYWTPEHPTGTYPQPGNQATAEQDDFGTTLGYFDASFLKIRTISLGYTFDKNLLTPWGCKALRIYMTCQNPFVLFSPYMKEGGLDPEATGIGPQGANTSMNGGLKSRMLTIGTNTPPTRNFLLGLNLTF